MYTNIEIDHIFRIVEPDFYEQLSIDLKDQIELKKDHVGQGTSARFLPFERNYLEFIWLSNLEESKSNQLQLYKRFTANQCPYGIAFRGKIDKKHREDFIEYNPTYSTGNQKILIHKSHFEDFGIPMLFVMDLGLENSALYPKNMSIFRGSNLQGGGFDSVTLKIKQYSKTLEKFPFINQEVDKTFQIEISGAHGPNLEQFNIYFK